MFVQFSNNIDRVLGHIIMRRHFERTFDAKKMVEESSVWAIVDTSIREVDWQIQQLVSHWDQRAAIVFVFEGVVVSRWYMI